MATEATEHASGMPQLEFSTFPNQIFWLFVALVIIYLVMSRVALPRIATVLLKRHNEIQGDLDKAEELKARAVEAETAYTQALADARSDSQTIIARARSEIKIGLDAAMGDADVEIAAKSAESEAEIAVIRDNAIMAVKDVANVTAAEIVKTIMPGAGDVKAVKAAVKARLKG